jgi:hypothetical protein
MKSMTLGSGLLVALFVATFSSVEAKAQAPTDLPISKRGLAQKTAKPTVSPYLNLLRNDGNRAENYYNLVKPQVNQQRVNRQQSAELAGLRFQAQQNIAAGFGAGTQRDQDPLQRNAAVFMNLSTYFGSR